MTSAADILLRSHPAVLIVLFLAIPLPGAAAQPPAEAELRAAEERLAGALVAKDVGAFEEILAPDFAARGAPDVARGAWIDNARKLCWGDRFEIADFAVARSDGDTAVVTLVLTTHRDPNTCERAVVRSLLTDIWRRDEGRWRLVLRHSGPAGASIETQFAKSAPPPPLWEGSAELSLVATGGNSRTETLGLGGTLTWRPDRWTTLAQASFVRSEALDVETARSFAVSVRQSRPITPRVEGFGRVEYLVNEFAGIDDRVTLDAGLAYRVLAGPAHRLSVDLGPGYSHEARLSSAAVSAALANVGSLYAWKIHRNAAIEHASLLTASLDIASDWRFRNTLSATATVSRVFSLKVSHELKYVNDPVPGFESTDRVLSAALVARF